MKILRTSTICRRGVRVGVDKALESIVLRVCCGERGDGGETRWSIDEMFLDEEENGVDAKIGEKESRLDSRNGKLEKMMLVTSYCVAKDKSSIILIYFSFSAEYVKICDAPFAFRIF